MSHRNSATATTLPAQLLLAEQLVNGGVIAILVLVLVLLISNGGAG